MPVTDKAAREAAAVLIQYCMERRCADCIYSNPPDDWEDTYSGCGLNSMPIGWFDPDAEADNDGVEEMKSESSR